MAQAATTGAMDFTRIDPRDKWWWRRLRWTLETVNNRNLREALETQHRHWVTLFANASLDNDSFSNTKEKANEYLEKVLKARFPWVEGAISPAAQATEDLVSEFRELYGYPGDPQYEQMLVDMMAAFSRLEAGIT